MHTRHRPEKLQFHSIEKWATLKGFNGADGQRYAVSNFGRFIAYWKTYEYGYFLKLSRIRNYPAIQLRKNGTPKGFLLHRLVAIHFCKKPGPAYRYVIHRDYKKENNYFTNLQWMTRDEYLSHMVKDPNYIRSKAQYKGRGQKLTTERVRLIKRKLAEGKTRTKIIARQFGISETQLLRIKSGANWGHVKE